MFFYDYFMPYSKNKYVRKAFFEECGYKLMKEGYCDVRKYLRGKLRKDVIESLLRAEDSPFCRLYARKTRFPSSPEEGASMLEEFIKINSIEKPLENMTHAECVALVNWVFRSYPYMSDGGMGREVRIRQMLLRCNRENPKDCEVALLGRDILFLNHYVEISTVDSMEGYLNFLDEMQQKNRGKTLFYRGHTSLSYMLNPSLMRKDRWLKNERKMYQGLLINCPASFDRAKSHLDYLAVMQHYGLPTRLLDITQNPLVALYFACKTGEEYGEMITFAASDDTVKYPQSDTAAILASLPMFDYSFQRKLCRYVKDADLSREEFNQNADVQRLLHEIRTEKPGFQPLIQKEDLCGSVIVIPIRNNDRIAKQDGAFIVSGIQDDEHREDMQREFTSDYLEMKRKSSINSARAENGNGKKAICILTAKKDKLLRELDLFGINKAKLFPEIDDVAEHLRNHIGMKS